MSGENNNWDSDSNEMALSSDTLAALNEFLLNQNIQENLHKADDIPRENWQVSSFNDIKFFRYCYMALETLTI